MSCVARRRRCTLFAVAVAPVDASARVPEEAPGPDSEVRVSAEVVRAESFAWIARGHAAHLAPVHAPRARFRDVHRAAVRRTSPAALRALDERVQVRGRRRDAENEQEEERQAHERTGARARFHHRSDFGILRATGT